MTQPTKKLTKTEIIIRIVGGTLDALFMSYLTFMFISSVLESGNFMAGFDYVLLYGVWCCSMTLVRIKEILDDRL